MKLDLYPSELTLPQRLHHQSESNQPELPRTELEEPSSTWVKLQESPSPYSHDEALLLCQHSDTEWIAWIPDYGEIVIHRGQFSEIH